MGAVLNIEEYKKYRNFLREHIRICQRWLEDEYEEIISHDRSGNSFIQKARIKRKDIIKDGDFRSSLHQAELELIKVLAILKEAGVEDE